MSDMSSSTFINILKSNKKQRQKHLSQYSNFVANKTWRANNYHLKYILNSIRWKKLTLRVVYKVAEK